MGCIQHKGCGVPPRIEKTEKPPGFAYPGGFSLLFLTAKSTARPMNFYAYQ